AAGIPRRERLDAHAESQLHNGVSFKVQGPYVGALDRERYAVVVVATRRERPAVPGVECPLLALADEITGLAVEIEDVRALRAEGGDGLERGARGADAYRGEGRGAGEARGHHAQRERLAVGDRSSRA